MTLLDGPRWGPREPGPARQLVVLCHGLGADGQDLIDLAPYWGKTLPHAAFAAPDAPQACDMGPFGRQWFSVTDRTPERIAAGAAAARTALDGFIDAELARLGLPAQAYALMGFSQGAMTVLYTGLRRAVAPRGVLAFSGALVAAGRLGEATARPPVLIVHGEDDGVVPAARSREAEAALAAAGFAVEAMYCPRLEHGIDEAGLAAGALFLQRIFAEP
ncbi:MAG: phospholipase [Acetobacteraceae bacterium]|nr:phospholipase [Acetobacteraceae bacterium]